MRITIAGTLMAGGLIVCSLTIVRAQAPAPTTNPFAGNAEAAQTGMGLFRARCADCHGMDARGVRGPDLTQVWASGRSDEGLFRTVRQGVPGTEMPAARGTDDEIWKLLAYVKTLASPVATGVPAGNAENGARVFGAQCAGCHRVNGRGGRLGPDLSRVGLSRARAALVRRIRGAEEDWIDGYEPVTVTTKNGQTVRGVKKNGDLFSVQVMDTRDRIQGYNRADVQTVAEPKQSAMPPFDITRLSENDLNDLLSYLSTLRGFDPSVK
ncbi:MAG: c-type cytochrome [Vicinamibacterales bacterium]